jgi:hypothetical protein
VWFEQWSRPTVEIARVSSWRSGRYSCWTRHQRCSLHRLRVSQVHRGDFRTILTCTAAKSANFGGAKSPLWRQSGRTERMRYRKSRKTEAFLSARQINQQRLLKAAPIHAPISRLPVVQKPVRLVRRGDCERRGKLLQREPWSKAATNVPIAATVEAPDSVLVHQTSPISKPSPAHAACRYALTRSGSIVKGEDRTFFEGVVATRTMLAQPIVPPFSTSDASTGRMEQNRAC